MSELTKKNLIMVKNIITERATFFLIVSPTKITNILMKCSEKVQFTTWLQLFLFRKKDVPEKERKKNHILYCLCSLKNNSRS